MKTPSNPTLPSALRDRLPLIGIAALLLIMAAVAAWMQAGSRQAGTTPAVAQEMPAVNPEERAQEAETAQAPPDPQLSEHERAVRRETLENMRQSAGAPH